ncbi:MAG: hypothetical protein IJY15_11110 [Thermoguttaceae bacterium]|nr:hypothetical protein [Thermoguttaceae bacterium]
MNRFCAFSVSYYVFNISAVFSDGVGGDVSGTETTDGGKAEKLRDRRYFPAL